MSTFWTSRVPAESTENESRGIPELGLHHVAVIATWRTRALHKPYLGEGVISECFFFVFTFLSGCVWGGNSLYTFVSYDLKTLTQPAADSSDTRANPVANKLHLYTTFICFATNVCLGNVFAAWICSLFFPVKEVLRPCNVGFKS